MKPFHQSTIFKMQRICRSALIVPLLLLLVLFVMVVHGSVPLLIDTDMGTDDVFAILHVLMKSSNNSSLYLAGMSMVTGMQLDTTNSIKILQELQAFTNIFTTTNNGRPLLFDTHDPKGLIPAESHSFLEGKFTR